MGGGCSAQERRRAFEGARAAAGRGRPPQAAARRAGLEFVEKLLTYGFGGLGRGRLAGAGCSLVAVDACRHIGAGVQSIVVGQVIGKVSEFHVAGKTLVCPLACRSWST